MLPPLFAPAKRHHRNKSTLDLSQILLEQNLVAQKEE